MPALPNLIDELEARIPHAGKTAPAVSVSPVGWHIAHTVMVTDGIIDAIGRSDPGQYEPKFSLLRSVILFTGYIPRGKGKSPKSMLPADTSEASLRTGVGSLRSRIRALDNFQPHHYFEHPYFGHLGLASAKRFLGIHTKHHLKIIDDIIRKHRDH